jgi:DNA-binding MurR/RpiR family transcriptional regulator
VDWQEDKASITVAGLIHKTLDRLTPTERKIATMLLSNYPFPGLETVAQLAKLGGVSNPTVLRLTTKLGFASYADFQSALRSELQARGATPLARGNAEPAALDAEADFLHRYQHSVVGVIENSLRTISRTAFDGTVALLSDTKRPVHLIGGRLTESLASQMCNHLRLLRPRVNRVLHASAVASEDIVDFDRRTVLVVFDIRRYQPAVIKLAQEAHRRGASVILFTDAWLSPISAFADHVFAVETEVSSNWDSFAPFSALIEALVASLSEQNWAVVRKRMNDIRDIRIALGDDIP